MQPQLTSASIAFDRVYGIEILKTHSHENAKWLAFKAAKEEYLRVIEERKVKAVAA